MLFILAIITAHVHYRLFLLWPHPPAGRVGKCLPRRPAGAAPRENTVDRVASFSSRSIIRERHLNLWNFVILNLFQDLIPSKIPKWIRNNKLHTFKLRCLLPAIQRRPVSKKGVILHIYEHMHACMYVDRRKRIPQEMISPTSHPSSERSILPQLCSGSEWRGNHLKEILHPPLASSEWRLFLRRLSESAHLVIL